MSKRHSVKAGRFSRRLAGFGIGIGGGLFALTLWISAEAATPTTVSSEATTSAARSDADKPATTSSSTKPATGKNATGIPQVEMINEAMRRSWADHKLIPSGPATDGEWCRRVFLDIIGRIPSVDELNRFLNDKTANRRVSLVDRLLGDDYTIEYARNWSGIWTNTLIGRPGKARDDAKLPTDREGMEQYLRDSFGRNKPYQKMVYELISATGATKPGEEGFNGAVNFLIGKMDDNGIQATAKTAQIFLGLSVQCTQCHNHPFNDWKQNSFWEMNAFFRQTKVKKTMGAKKVVEHAVLTNQDFRGEGAGGDMSSAEIYYEQRNGIMKIAYPVFVDGKEISRSGSLKQSDRRTELAKLIVNSDYMAKALVNRMWGHFMGYGFTKPIDDMGPHNPPSNPELLDGLAAEFSKHRYTDDGYDLKQLIRWIVLSEPYALSSHFNKSNRGDDPSLGEKPQFSHFYIRQMTAEQLYESMLTATGADNARGNSAERQAAKNKWLEQFIINFGTDDGGQTSTFNGSIPQTLMMFNGEMMQDATKAEKGTFLDIVANNPRLSAADKVNYLYLAGLSRRPNSAEMDALYKDTQAAATMPKTETGGRRGPPMARRMQSGGAPVTSELAKLQDLWWAILNSNEFILNH